MLPKVAKRPKRQGLGPYRNKRNVLAKNFFCHFWPFFGHFWPVGIEKTIFVKNVFSKSCFYWSKRKKIDSLSPNSKKGVFVKRSSVQCTQAAQAVKMEKIAHIVATVQASVRIVNIVPTAEQARGS